MLTSSAGWIKVPYKPGWLLGVTGHGVRNFQQYEKAQCMSENVQSMQAENGIIRSISGFSLEKTRDDHEAAVCVEYLPPSRKDTWLQVHREPEQMLESLIRESVVFPPVSTRLFEISHVIYPMNKDTREE